LNDSSSYLPLDGSGAHPHHHQGYRIIHWRELSQVEHFDEGTFGIVLTARWNGKKVAVKKLKKLISNKAIKDFALEKEILKYVCCSFTHAIIIIIIIVIVDHTERLGAIGTL
jgi:hypothetical protein